MGVMKRDTGIQTIADSSHSCVGSQYLRFRVQPAKGNPPVNKGSAWGDWALYTDSPLRAFEDQTGVTHLQSRGLGSRIQVSGQLSYLGVAEVRGTL